MKNLLFVLFLFPAVLFSQKIKIEPLTFDFGLTVTRKEGYRIYEILRIYIFITNESTPKS